MQIPFNTMGTLTLNFTYLLFALVTGIIGGTILSMIAGQAKLKQDKDGIQRVGFSKVRIIAAILTFSYVANGVVALSSLIWLSPYLYYSLNLLVNTTMLLGLLTVIILLIPRISNKLAGRLTLGLYALMTVIVTIFLESIYRAASYGYTFVPISFNFIPVIILSSFLWLRKEAEAPPPTLLPLSQPKYPLPPDVYSRYPSQVHSQYTPPTSPQSRITKHSPATLPSKGMEGQELSFCSLCGANIPPGVRICPSCGSEN